MELLPTDFESAASASSAIPARVSALAIGAVSIAAFADDTSTRPSSVSHGSLQAARIRFWLPVNNTQPISTDLPPC